MCTHCLVSCIILHNKALCTLHHRKEETSCILSEYTLPGHMPVEHKTNPIQLRLYIQNLQQKNKLDASYRNTHCSPCACVRKTLPIYCLVVKWCCKIRPVDSIFVSSVCISSYSAASPPMHEKAKHRSCDGGPSVDTVCSLYFGVTRCHSDTPMLSVKHLFCYVCTRNTAVPTAATIWYIYLYVCWPLCVSVYLYFICISLKLICVMTKLY